MSLYWTKVQQALCQRQCTPHTVNDVADAKVDHRRNWGTVISSGGRRCFLLLLLAAALFLTCLCLLGLFLLFLLMLLLLRWGCLFFTLSFVCCSLWSSGIGFGRPFLLLGSLSFPLYRWCVGKVDGYFGKGAESICRRPDHWARLNMVKVPSHRGVGEELWALEGSYSRMENTIQCYIGSTQVVCCKVSFGSQDIVQALLAVSFVPPK